MEKMVLLWMSFVFLGIVGFSAHASDRNEDDFHFVHRLYLDYDQKVLVKWTTEDKHVTFEVEAETQGYIGLGFSPNGGMKNSDIVLGYFDPEDQPRLLDMFAYSETLPSLDQSQDVVLLGSSRNDTHITFRFARKWRTCDENDRDLLRETNHLIWAFSDSIPTEQNGQFSFQYHLENRGQKTVMLNSSNIFTTPDSDVWIVETPEIPLPNNTDTLYYCQIVQFPKIEQKHHIIGLTPMVNDQQLRHLHHVILYECGFSDPEVGLSFVGKPGKLCYQPGYPQSWFKCRNPLIAWATGSPGIFYPEEYGLPIDSDRPQFFMLEVHFDNSAMIQGAIAKGSMKVFYTPDLRPLDGGTLQLGRRVNRLDIIPPGQKDWNLVSYLQDCFSGNVGFPDEGILLHSVVHHTHFLGRKVRARLFRNGTELEPLTIDNAYDFNYQQIIFFPEPRRIFKDDIIAVECHYDSTSRKKLTQGGLASMDEMCLVFFTYTPEIDLFQCTAASKPQAIENTFDVKLKPLMKKKTQNLLIGSFSVDTGKGEPISLQSFMKSEKITGKEYAQILKKNYDESPYDMFYESITNGKHYEMIAEYGAPQFKPWKPKKDTCGK